MSPRGSLRLAGVFAVFGVIAAVGSAVLADDEDEPKKKKKDSDSPSPSVYAGTFINRKTGAKGPIRAHLKPSEEGPWEGKFEGTFRGQNFEYNVEFDATAKGKKTDLKGNATIDGDPYTWKGSLQGDSMTIDYKSTKGYNGVFTLKKSNAKTPPPKKKGK